MRRPYLFAIGGAHIDRRGRLRGTHVAEASNPGTMREEIGGAAFNAARCAVWRGVCVSFLSVRGGDTAGEKVAEAVDRSGMQDLSATFLDRTTPSYTAILTQAGELITGLADMALYEHGFSKQLRRRKVRDMAGNADAFLCDANMPADALEQLADLADGKPVYAIAVSPAKVERLAPIMARLSCLFMNRREACHLAGVPTDMPPHRVAKKLVEKGLGAGVITAGGEPALCFAQGDFCEIAPANIGRVADVTGAGDALAGTTVAALVGGLAFTEAVREGMAAAKLAVESESAAPEMDEDTFRAAHALVPQPQKPV